MTLPLKARLHIIYHFPGFAKSFWAATFIESIIKLGTNRPWLEVMHAMDMVLPCKYKGIAPEIAVLKRQTKFLKSTCEVVSFYYICKLYTWNLLRTILSQAFLKDFAKITCDFPLCVIVKNLTIYFAEHLSDIFFTSTTLPLFIIKFLE